MRKAVYEYLKTNCKSVKNWWQPYSAPVEAPKPYGIIYFDEEIRSAVNILGHYQPIELFIYMDSTKKSIGDMDVAIKEIIELLNGKSLVTSDGRTFVLEYIGIGADSQDSALKSIIRPIFFRVATAFATPS